MEHPVQYLTVVTKFLDRMIEEHGDQLFMVFTFLCLGWIAWRLSRKRERPVQDAFVVVLTLPGSPRRPSEPVVFREDESS